MTQKIIELGSINQIDFFTYQYKPVIIEYSAGSRTRSMLGYIIHDDIVEENIYISSKKENYSALLGLMGRFEKKLNGITVIRKKDITKIITFDTNGEYVIKRK